MLLFFGGCNGCDIEKVAENLNNGNDGPKVLIIETWGTEIRNALATQFGEDCLGTANFTARVDIEVRTASLVNNQIVMDENPFFETVLLQQSYTNNTGLNDGTQIEIMVPEHGAYSIRYLIEVQICSICCHGSSDTQCGTQVTEGRCQAGFPRVIHEAIFPTHDMRPRHDNNYEILSDKFTVRECACGCFTDC